MSVFVYMPATMAAYLAISVDPNESNWQLEKYEKI